MLRIAETGYCNILSDPRPQLKLVDEWKTNLMSLVILFHLLCAQHVSDINISKPAKQTSPNISRNKSSNIQHTENKTTDVVIHQHSRRLLKMDILISETCWAHKKWNKIASDIKLVFHSSTIAMMHGPINTKYKPILGASCKAPDVFVRFYPNLHISREISLKVSNTKSHENPSSGRRSDVRGQRGWNWQASSLPAQSVWTRSVVITKANHLSLFMAVRQTYKRRWKHCVGKLLHFCIHTGCTYTYHHTAGTWK